MQINIKIIPQGVGSSGMVQVVIESEMSYKPRHPWFESHWLQPLGSVISQSQACLPLRWMLTLLQAQWLCCSRGISRV